MKLTVILVLISLQACLPFGEKSDLRFETNDSFDPPVTAESPFETLKREIYTPRCMHCHSMLALQAYPLEVKWIIPGDPENSPLYLAVKSGMMPLPRRLPDGSYEEVKVLNENELKQIRDYINQLPPLPKG